MKKISIFKLFIIIFSIVFLGILFRYSQILNEYAQNGRYFYVNRDGARDLIIDTRDGAAYSVKPEFDKIIYEKANDGLSR